MTRQRFEFALERLKSSDWKRFEEFASEFLSTEFRELRTVANASGDQGRDAELFSPTAEPSVVLQYSVAADWEKKIRSTAKRIDKTLPNASLLIYVTNQPIGSLGDSIKLELRQNYRLALDIRDRSWFLDRQFSDSYHEEASERLSREVVDPYLAERAIASPKSQILSNHELQAAFVYLKMQWDDASQDKGLTKLCFDALVRAVLRGTDSDNRLSRTHVKQGVREILSVHPADVVDRFTDSALLRLNKKVIRHWRHIDEFCLTHEEKLKVQEKILRIENEEARLQRELEQIVKTVAKRAGARIPRASLPEMAKRVRRVLEKTIFLRGEAFVAAVRTGSVHQTTPDDIREVTIKDLGEYPEPKRSGTDFPAFIAACIDRFVAEPSDTSLSYLRSLSDTYTLLAFLQEAPDVQSAVSKMFSGGTIWLDTSFILPLFAEEILKPEARRFQSLVQAARESGLHLRATGGVLEETERHMNRCLSFARTPSTWKGKVPFLVAVYASTGRSLKAFPSWLETFRGHKRPEDDIAEAMQRMFGILLEDLEQDAAKASPELRQAVEEVFHDERGRRKYWDQDSHTRDRLVKHDSENYLGVLMRRRNEQESPFGYSAWWLTLHRSAFYVREELKSKLIGRVPASPVLSPDFLVNYFALGPIRRKISKSTETKLPLGLDLGIVDYPQELILSAERAREEMGDLPEHLVRRKVRDHFDAARMRFGSFAKGGLQHAERILTGTAASEAANDPSKHPKSGTHTRHSRGRRSATRRS